MARIHHPPQRHSKTPPAPSHREAPRESAPPPDIPEPSGKDSFIQGLAAAVYRNHPLVILCTQPQILSWASKIPVIKDVADAFCPAVAEQNKDAVVK